MCEMIDEKAHQDAKIVLELRFRQEQGYIVPEK
jgi:hypothetical protein